MNDQSISDGKQADFDRREVLIAVNPNAGVSETRIAAEELAECLKASDYAVSIESNIGEIERISRERRQELKCVVAAGGDGTIGLLVNRLDPATTFAILPQGTENLLAKFLEIPFAPSRVAELVNTGIVVPLDAGRANGRLFLVMASCGFDAHVVHQVHGARKGHIRHWAYAKPIVDSIRKYRYPIVSVLCDDDLEPSRIRWAFVFNAPRYAMGLPIADGANAMDGWLDLCGFRGGNLLNGLLYFAGILTRQHRRWRDTVIRRAKRIRMSADEPVPYQIDGDPGGHLPLELEIVPKRVNIIVPVEWSKQHLHSFDSEISSTYNETQGNS